MTAATRRARSAGINTRREGDSATYTPAAGAAESVQVVLLESVDPLFESGQMEKHVVGLIAVAALSVTPAVGDSIATAGSMYTVDDVPPSLNGIWRLALMESLP